MQEIIEHLKHNIAHDKYIYISEDIFRKLNEMLQDENYPMLNEIVLQILDEFAGKYMFRLPEAEIRFNQWLKENDPEVWNDLWMCNEDCECDSRGLLHAQPPSHSMWEEPDRFASALNDESAFTNCECDGDGSDSSHIEWEGGEHHHHHAPPGFDDLYYVSINLLPVVLNLDGRGLPICDLQTTPNYYFCMENMVDEESKIVIEIAQKLFREGKPMTTAQWLALEISLDPIDIWHFAYRHKIDLAEAKAAVKQLVDDDALVHLTEAEYLLPFIYF